MDNVNKYKVFYIECNTHLRQQDTKRDQNIVFFSSVTGIVVSLSSSFSLPWFIFLFLFLVGLFININLIRYKSWHEKYVIAANVIGKAMNYTDMVTKEKFNEFLMSSLQHKKLTFNNVYWSSESMTIGIYMLINSVNIIMALMMSLTIYIIEMLIIKIAIITAAVVIYFSFNLFFIYRNMREVYGIKDTEKIWILRIW
jgi:hypothetical protein